MSNAARQLELGQASPRCEVCGVPVSIKPTGRPRQYCSNRCRQKAARSRHIIQILVSIERMKADLGIEIAIDWSDEDHRVA
ncbi:DNA gyrase inhibitor YacG [Stenotrophomonas sp. MMGLT7]|uniref:DNA gyrase inhibitor YacG n=1 Tax=Stenotrophomonas sp. MMGLT7 TaxID=2901227 RepID=UPI001E3BAAE8|nr:DNA gyrase inhibitor YacG [Stenotrophomonas sp. MMGLT7]MCD7097178.1 DNA gyrase inhibitor YacG [Stenotrophomonas sp. MMGLT7]